MNLALVNTSWLLGGAETIAHDLLDGCRDAGHRTRMFVAAGKTYPHRDDLVPLYPRALSRAYHTRFNPLIERLAPRARWTDRRFRALADGWPDLIHVHNFHGDYATIESLAHVCRRKPLVWTFHGHWGVTGGCDHPVECRRFEAACGECPRLGIWPLGAVDDTAEQLRRKMRLIGELELDVVAPSTFIADRIRRSQVGRRWRVHHIPNGVCTSTFSGARKSDPDFKRELGLDPCRSTILVVNRNFTDPQKGFATIRSAVSTPSLTSAQVVLAGEHSRWAASQLPGATAVIDAGYVRDRTRMAAWFEAADIVLFASPAETFPCVVLEAMAAECCVVATPTSGVTEQIEDGRTGLLAVDGSGASLGRALQAALANPEAARARGRAAREFVERTLSRDLFIRRHLELYAGVSARVSS